MTLRKKALLIIGVPVISLVAIVYFVSRLILLEDVMELEKHQTHREVERALGALYHVIADLEVKTLDGAAPA